VRLNAHCPISTGGRACASSAAVSFLEDERPPSDTTMEKTAIQSAAEGVLRNQICTKTSEMANSKPSCLWSTRMFRTLASCPSWALDMERYVISHQLSSDATSSCRLQPACGISEFVGLTLTLELLCSCVSASGALHKQTVIVGVAAKLLHMNGRSLTVLVTPLNGIGRQHVRTFQKAGIECRGLCGSTSELERLTLNEAVASRSLVIFVASPEAIVNNPTLISKIKAVGLGLVAFDEAHLFEAWSRWRPDLTLAASGLDCGRR